MKRRAANCGYALLAAIIAVNIFTILILKARTMWETTIQRDLEQELLFRARQYANAIEWYKKKNANLNPKNLEELYEKKFLRKLFKDPMTEEGNWDIVMRDGRPGKKGLLIVPEEMLPQWITQAVIVGVCSTSPEEGFLVYRKKKKYNEWAVYMGEKIEKEMPELKYVGQPGFEEDDRSGGSTGSRGPTGSRDGRE
jgi:hypothetical protein